MSRDKVGQGNLAVLVLFRFLSCPVASGVLASNNSRSGEAHREYM